MYAGQGNWAIVAGRKPVALLKQGANVRKRSFLEISPVSTDCWKSWANTGPNYEGCPKMPYNCIISKRHKTAKLGVIAMKLRTSSRQNMRIMSI